VRPLPATDKMDSLCNFLVFVLPHPLEIFLLTSLAITTIVVTYTDIDVTMCSKFVSGLGHSYKLTNIFLINKIAGSKIYRFYSFAENLSSDHISKNAKIFYSHSSQMFESSIPLLNLFSKYGNT